MGSGTAPLYHRVFATLRARITAGEYPVGSQMPTEGALMEAFGAGRQTIRTAMDLLEREGLVQRFAGRGTFVQNRGGSQSRWTLDSIEDLIEFQPCPSLRDSARRNGSRPVGAQFADAVWRYCRRAPVFREGSALLGAGAIRVFTDSSAAGPRREASTRAAAYAAAAASGGRSRGSGGDGGSADYVQCACPGRGGAASTSSAWNVTAGHGAHILRRYRAADYPFTRSSAP